MKEIVKSVVDVSRYIFERGLVPGKAGNVSARINSEDGFIIAITPTLVSLHDLNDDDIVLVKDNGEILSKGKPSSEVNMHLAIYREKPEVNGIVHAHSPYATGFAFSDKKLKRLEGFGAIKSEYVKEVPYEKPGSIELAEKVNKDDKKYFIWTTGSWILKEALLDKNQSEKLRKAIADGNIAVSIPQAESIGKATVSEHCPTQDISCTVSILFICILLLEFLNIYICTE